VIAKIPMKAGSIFQHIESRFKIRIQLQYLWNLASIWYNTGKILEAGPKLSGRRQLWWRAFTGQRSQHTHSLGVSEYDYAGWWKNEPLEVIKGPVTGLPIPAHDEIAFEGDMLPLDNQAKPEGPFAEFTGHYSPSGQEAVFRVKSILHRNNPIILVYLAIWVGSASLDQAVH